jgi:hypothetical protein
MIARLLRAAGLLSSSPAARSSDRKAAERQAAQRQQLRELAKEVANLTTRLQQLERGLDQLRALRAADDDLRARSLLDVLDAGRTARHVRDAVGRAVRRDDPVPHLIVRDVWPPELVAAILGTMPGPPFFQPGPAGREFLRLPPRLAPPPAMVVLAFAGDLVRDVLGPALAARFGDLLPARSLTASAGTLVRHPPDDLTIPADHRPGHVLTTVIDLDGGMPNQAVAIPSVAAARPGVLPQPAAPVRLTWEFAHYPSDAASPTGP